MMDPFNPRPGPMHGEEHRERPYDMQPRGSGKAFVWVPVAIVGGVGALIVLASL